MRPSAVLRVGPACVWLLVSVTAVAGCATERPARPPVPVEGLPAARAAAPDPRVGAVFLGEGDVHTCTGAVLASPSANLVLTAAHCLTAGVDARFVPGFGDDSDDAGDDVWQVDAVYLDPRWVAEQDPVADFAVARVERADGARLESVAGQGLRLGEAPALGENVTVLGYPAGVGGGPSACRAPAAVGLHGFPALHCDGIVGGFSGAPWISGSTVSGLIGGLDGGGCADEVSYSPRFGSALTDVVSRAQAGAPADQPPEVVTDECP